MKPARLLTPVFAVLLLAGSAAPRITAQKMRHRAPAPRSTTLTLVYKGESLAFSPAQFAALPHVTVTVYNAHTRARETYSGVPLATLLARLDVPQGEKVRGRLFMTGVVAEGTDGYQVLYALAEVDPTIHTGQVLVADSENGRPIAADGAFKMISTEEKRPARWVRNLDKISVVTVHP